MEFTRTRKHNELYITKEEMLLKPEDVQERDIVLTDLVKVERRYVHVKLSLQELDILSSLQTRYEGAHVRLLRELSDAQEEVISEE
jgi:hypothetical protein|tara:strand:+ start:411 stop:668 length:258 start_codon:yes stop_codon:yes gene_type:complete